MARVALTVQIAEVRRELAMRRNVYPRQVSKGTMRQSEAELCIARMEGVLETLIFCQNHEDEIRTWMAEKQKQQASGEASSPSREGAR